MKITKAEKIWLAAVIIFYACYNLPFVPPYGMAKATIIHGLITLIPLWIAIYAGFAVICRIYRIRDHAGDDADLADKRDEDGHPAGEAPVPASSSPAPAQEVCGAIAEDILVPVKPSPAPAQEVCGTMSGDTPFPAEPSVATAQEKDAATSGAPPVPVKPSPAPAQKWDSALTGDNPAKTRGTNTADGCGEDDTLC